MSEFIWKSTDFHSVAMPSGEWEQRPFADPEHGPPVPHIGPSFADVRVRQSAMPHGSLPIQAKLAVSHPADGAEMEADRMADAVMQMPDPQATVAREDEAVQRACAACEGGEKEVSRAAEDEEEVMRAAEDEEEVMRAPEDEEEVMRAAHDEEDKLQAKSGGVPGVTPEIESDIRGRQGGGHPLSPESRSFFEPRLGADLGQVRVHTGTQAARTARQLQARAFTVGSDITFGAGQYQPSSNEGKRLMAHELTHVIQQGGAGPKAGGKGEDA